MKKILIKWYEKIRRLKHVLIRSMWTPKIPVNANGEVYVNLGCGLNSGQEFINIDVLKLPNIHHVQDITKLVMFADNSVDLIYASHVVEHLPREKFAETLGEWRRALKPGGRLRISVPDFDNLIEVYLGHNRDVLAVRDQVLGQKPPYDNHYTLWNFAFAQKTFSDLGFSNITRWDPATAAHHGFTDRSARVFEVAGKKIPLSLNLEMTKS